MRFIDCINITGESCKAYKGNKEYISTGAVDVDHIDRNQIEIVNYDSKPSRANLITDDKSILFAKMQGTKKVLLIDQELDKNIYSTGFFSIAPKQNVLKKECLYYLLGSKTFLSQKDKYCTGATQKSITLEGLKKIEITVPNLEEQDRIVKILDTINNILESYKKELENYDRLVKARFVEMFMKNHKDKYPVRVWDQVVTIKHGRDYKNNVVAEKGFPVYGSGGFMGVYANKYLVNENATIIGRKGTIDNPIYVPEKLWNVDTAFGIEVNDEVLNPIFFYVRSTMYDLKSLSTSTTLPSMTKNTLLKLEIGIPPLGEQNEFADFAKQVDKSKLAVQKSLEKTQQLFDSLMQEYFG